MSSEEQQHSQATSNSGGGSDNRNPSSDTYYSRKKNWIGGVDNDTVLGVGIGIIGALASVAAYPIFKNIWENFTTRLQQQQYYAQQQQLAQEGYIPPTEAQNINGQPVYQNQPTLPQQQQQPAATAAAPQQNEQQQEEEAVDDDDDGVFYEKELKRRQKVMGMKRKGSKYESPFGRDIGGLG